MWSFKKKQPVEQFVHALIEQKLPRAVQFFDRENEHSHHPIQLDDRQLLEIGGGMCLFFLGKYFPDTNPANLKVMSRAYKELERILPDLNARPKEAYAWWKAFTDGLIFQEKEARLRIACRLVWEKVFPQKAYREATPLKTFGYFLEMEVDAAEKLKIH